jgi:hypothetical protein
MINLFRKDDINTKQMHSVTFRVSSDDKSKLSRVANELKISLSEYVRNKALMDDIELQKIMEENTRLREQNKELQIHIKSKFTGKTESGTIVIHLSEENKRMISKVLSNSNWNRFTKHLEVIENDYELSKALLFILVEYLIEPLGDMSGLRSKHNIDTPETLFYRIAESYMK